MRRKKTIEITEDDSLLNLTPLIDVVFVVLIIFILIAPMLQVDSILLAEGIKEGKELTESGKSPIVIEVKQDNSIWMYGKKVSLEDLNKLLEESKKKYAVAKPQLLQDKRASFGTYQSVKNSVEVAGFTELDVLLTPSISQ